MTKSAKKALVIANHGRHYLVDHDGKTYLSVTRGKKRNVAVGDHVMISVTANDQAVIESIEERRNLLYRSDQLKSKLMAANVSRLFIVVATEPGFSDELISRALVAAETAGIDPHVILNKKDVVELLPFARERLLPYKSLGYPVHEISAAEEPEEACEILMPLVKDQVTILLGQSGMGKSSIINILIPGINIRTREISTALNSGKHTTTLTSMYRVDENSALVDSPGFHEFGLYHLDRAMLAQAFREFLPYLGRCRFHNCAHLVEPGCAILEAVEKGHISPMRQYLYAELFEELSQKHY